MAEDPDPGLWIVRSYVYRLFRAICGMFLFGVAGIAAMAIGGAVSNYLGLSENAAMWLMLGVFFMPLFVMVWWPQNWWPRR
jgi:hypothetical protein